MANPPFNVSGFDRSRMEKDPRFPFGLPSTNNANYIWISLFYTALNETGRAGFVMANSAGMRVAASWRFASS
jgi:type I restriction enzyme M protein